MTAQTRTLSMQAAIDEVKLHGRYWAGITERDLIAQLDTFGSMRHAIDKSITWPRS